jgi:hypothetical protein
LLSRRRFWVLATVLAATFVYEIVVVDPQLVPPPSAPAAFIGVLKDILHWLFPFVTGVAVGDSFAIDRHCSWASFVLTRGLTRRRYIIAKGLGMAIAICLLLTMSMTAAGVATVCTKGLSPTIRTAEFGMINAADHASYLAHPWWFVARFAGVHLLAATAYSTTALLLAVWVPIPFVVSIIPPTIFFAATVMLPETAWNPLGLLRLETGTMSGRFLYFLVWLVVAAAVAVIAYGKQEDP